MIRGTSWGQPDLESGLLQSSYVWVTQAAPHRLKGKLGSGERVTHSPSSAPTASREFCLDDIWGPVLTTQRVTIPLFGTISIHGNTGVWGHWMQVHMLAEPAWSPKLPTSVILTATHGDLHPGSSWVPICLRNLSAHSVEVPTKVIVGKVTLANQVPPVVLLTETQRGPPTLPRKDGSWRNWTSKPTVMAQSRTRRNHGAAAQVGTPVCLQWPGPGQNILN